MLLSRVNKTDEQIAESMGAPRDVVTRWKLGERVPGERYRRLLASEFEIPVDSWEQPAIAAAAVLPRKEPFTFASGCDQLQRLVERMIDRAEYYAREGDEKMAHRCTRDGVAALVQLGKITGESIDITSSKAVRLPAVRRFVDKVIRSLRNCPEGLKLVITALESEDDGNANPHPR